MARLNWENVQAPDFSTSLEALKAGAASFNQAFGQTRGLVDGIKADQTDRANKEFALAAARFTSPEELQAALAADPTLGVRADRLSAGTINGGLERVNNLLETQKGQLGLKSADLGFRSATADFDIKQRDRGRTEESYQRVRAAGPIIEEFAAAARANDTGKMKELEGRLSGMLEADELFSVLKGGDGFLDDGRTRTRTAGSDDWTNLQRDWQKLDYEEGRSATELSEKLMGSLMPGEDVQAFINKNPDMFKGYSPQVIAAARGKASALLGLAPGGGDMGGGAPGIPGGGGGGGPLTGGTGAGGKNVADVLLGDGQGRGGGNAYGFNPPKPISQMTMGELYNFQRNVMVPETARRGVGGGQGSSAAGAYQIVSRTLASVAPKVLGPNWQSMPFTLENQDKIAEYLFNDAKARGVDLHSVWEGIPRGTTIDKYRNMSWAQARNMITKVESGGTLDPTALRATNSRNNVNAQQNVTFDRGTQIAADFGAAAQDTQSTAIDIARKMTAKGGPMEGEDPKDLAAVILRVQEGHEIQSAAVAGRIVARAGEGGNKGWWRRQFTGKQGWWGSGLDTDINGAKISELVKIAKDPRALADAVAKVEGTQRAQAGATASEQAYNQALANYQAIRQRAVDRLGEGRADSNQQVQAAARILREAEQKARAGGANLQGAAEYGQMFPNNQRTPPAPPPAPRRTAPPRGQGLIFRQPPAQRPAGNAWQQALQQYGPLGRGPVK